MTYVVTEKCIKCKYMDCAIACPVRCFHEGRNMLVIDPDECIGCDECRLACPIKAITTDADPAGGRWIALNADFAKRWPRATQKKPPPPDAASWVDTLDKFDRYFDPSPARDETA